MAETRVRSHVKIGDESGGFRGVLRDFDLFAGGAVGAAGDLDGNGVSDLVVGQVRDDDGGTNSGAFWVLFLEPSGEVRDFQKISATEGGLGFSLPEWTFFGGSPVGIGDLDGDCVPEIAVGASGDQDGFPGDPDLAPGAVWILFMKPDGTVKRAQKISATQGGFTGQLTGLDCFGCALSPLDDLDGDGVPELAVGALRDGDGGLDRGAVWILFLNPDGTVKRHQKISSLAGGLVGPLVDFSQFGASCSVIDDLDGDGIRELAVGALAATPPYHGAVYVLFLDRQGRVRAEQCISGGNGGFSGGLDTGDSFVFVESLGDLDEDGVGEIVVGAFGDDDGGHAVDDDRGAVWLLLLRPDGSVKSSSKISATRGGLRAELDSGDQFGFGLALLDDLDGDGIRELAVGAPGDDGQGQDRGAVYVLFLGQRKDRLAPEAPRDGGRRGGGSPVLTQVPATPRRVHLTPRDGSVPVGALPVVVLDVAPGRGTGESPAALGRPGRLTVIGRPYGGWPVAIDLPRDRALAGTTLGVSGVFLHRGLDHRPRAWAARVTVCPQGPPITHVTIPGVPVR